MVRGVINKNRARRAAGIVVAATAAGAVGVAGPGASAATAGGSPATPASLGVAGLAAPLSGAEVPLSASAKAILAGHGIAVDGTSPQATITATGADTYRNQQWGFDAIDAPAANTVSTGENVVVAVIDTGVARVSEFGSRVLPGTDLIASGDGTNDLDGHGTGVASIIAATTNNAWGIAGIAPNVKILPVRVCAPGGCPLDAVAAGIIWAVDHGAQVINLSLGGVGTPALESAITYAEGAGVPVAASTGNSAKDGNPVLYPGGYDSVVGTGAVNNTRARADFSEFGPQVDVVAPGVGIAMAYPAEKFVLGSGTSQAAPHVAAAMALAKSVKPSVTPAQLRAAIAASAVDLGVAGRDDQFGAGLLNAAGLLKALGAAAAPAPGPSVPAPVVSAVTPVSGSTGGGTLVTITGSGFTSVDASNPAAVRFGSTPAASFTVTSNTAITAIAPAGADAQQITVTNGAGASVNTKVTFTYRAPLGASFTSTAVPLTGGTVIPVTVTGGTAGATAAAFAGERITARVGGVAATVAWVDATHLKVTAPASTRSAALRMQLVHDGVAGPESESAVQYGPAVTAVAPQIVNGGGGTTVKITGAGFAGVDASDPAAVRFGDLNAQSFTVVNATTITAVTPAGLSGPVPVRVTTGGGSSAATVAATVRARAPLGFTVADGTVAKASGGTVVTLTVTGGTVGATPKEFAAESISLLLGTTRISPVWVDATHLKATLPPSATAVTLDLVIVHDTVTGPATPITYVPVVTGLSANTDTTAGGRKVVVRVAGAGSGPAGFRFGDTPAVCTAQAAGAWSCTVPAVSSAGPTWVSFTTASGAVSRFTAAAAFSYTDLD
ncbi:Serine protease, subtilisin family [Actinoplanes philippinensis]|uniref:Serine protease, subtilisin family n=1 Tax=Actinoplanes philippinensis TaxID=35752 RepID=A0A1I2HZH9_9ACTN|nr:Serine protease, subtilisin family [Actinoplanes philippinensis]